MSTILGLFVGRDIAKAILRMNANDVPDSQHAKEGLRENGHYRVEETLGTMIGATQLSEQ